MKRSGGVVMLMGILLFTYSCKDPFIADLKSTDSGVLVVDGYIDVSENAITHVTIGKTTSVNTDTEFAPETGATVSIEDEDNNFFPLSEASPGDYKSGVLSLPQNKSYRLKIIRSDERTYYSEFIQPIITPAIDSVSWKEFSDGVEIYVSTHDPENKTNYYQWDYNEVWERTMPFTSYYGIRNGYIKLRPVAEIQAMKTCWVYVDGADINTQSSLQNTMDIIPRNIVHNIPRFDERLFIRYSITVSQHALSKEAYQFYEILKKNGRMGTFSDPMPSELPRNVYRVGSDEQVVGFMGVYTTETKRIEIHEEEISSGWVIGAGCEEFGFTLEELIQLGDAYVITMATPNLPDTTIRGASAVPFYCADCRTRGGSTIRPAFWPAFE